MYEKQAEFVAQKFLEAFYNTQRLYLALVSAGCVAVFMGMAWMFGWPVYMKAEASLLASAAPLVGVTTVIVAMIGTLVIGSILLGRLRYEAGLFTACVGLAALASRGGTVGALLRGVGKPQVYLTLLMESIMLLGVFGLAWQLLGWLQRQGWLRAEPPLGEHELPGTWPQKLLATLVQATVTALLILLIAQVDSKKQVMASVVIASMLGATAAHQAVPVRPSAVFWIGPMLVGMVGYAIALRWPGQWMIGTPANALASASPLDYASLGTAGAIYGFWTSRHWRDGVVAMDLPEDSLD